MWRAALLAAWVALPIAWVRPAQAACGVDAAALSAGAQDSRWNEHDAEGRRLLREQGRLPEAALALSAACGSWSGELSWRHAVGERDYAGLSNRGAAVQTHSSLRMDESTLSVQRPLLGGIKLGLRAQRQATRRELASTGAVLGYPERHRHWVYALGALAEGAAWGESRWRLAAWVGGGPGGRVRIDLPIADPVTLRTGVMRQAELQLQWLSAPWAEGWRSSLGLRWRGERIGAGDATTLWRQGVAVGGALQPRHELRSAGLEVGVLRTF
ncbi:hypothetical protein [Roseateles sp.]|uniref:hypothetical protein n=1 Tax=Roseateles sp. TaxID=1971397 RepID=UPI00286BF5C8|nr:hypothetical protein [Roseateles sp.]